MHTVVPSRDTNSSCCVYKYITILFFMPIAGAYRVPCMCIPFYSVTYPALQTGCTPQTSDLYIHDYKRQGVGLHLKPQTYIHDYRRQGVHLKPQTYIHDYKRQGVHLKPQTYIHDYKRQGVHLKPQTYTYTTTDVRVYTSNLRPTYTTTDVRV